MLKKYVTIKVNWATAIHYFTQESPYGEYDSDLKSAILYVCFPQSATGPPLFLKACFHLSLIYLWDFTDWKEITWGKLGYLQWFFPALVDDYWQVFGVNKCVSADDCEASKDWILTLLHLCVRWGKWVSLLEIGSDRWGTWKKTATPALQPGWIRKLTAN